MCEGVPTIEDFYGDLDEYYENLYFSYFYFPDFPEDHRETCPDCGRPREWRELCRFCENRELYKRDKRESLNLLKALVDNGADVNARDEHDRLPIHLAVSFGSTEVVEALIAAGANVNVRDKDGQSSIHLAAFFNSTKVVEALIAAGADVNVRNEHGRSPVHLAVSFGGTEVVEDRKSVV